MGSSTGELTSRDSAPRSYLFIRLFNLGEIIEVVFHSDADDVHGVRSRQPLFRHQLTEMLLKSTDHSEHHLDAVPKSHAPGGRHRTSGRCARPTGALAGEQHALPPLLQPTSSGACTRPGVHTQVPTVCASTSSDCVFLYRYSIYSILTDI